MSIPVTIGVMPDDSETYQQLITRLPVGMHEALKAQAEHERRTMAEVTREALRRYLAAQETT